MVDVILSYGVVGRLLPTQSRRLDTSKSIPTGWTMEVTLKADCRSPAASPVFGPSAGATCYSTLLYAAYI
ncbi:uncharacterized protein N7503_008416 [Penicillium pulvis]|uniref:uncharacterized protein n=1 Tax=Penicillium pulvis TaxID=1562058 RepID=UPI002546C467|nr:uncharacterized protein N7503_008416 [Penicillium pulvis]KAJ5792438.1 hypothetical protein N7503_008416 [Penicillium pulvis]